MRDEKTIFVSKIRLLWEPLLEDETLRKILLCFKRKQENFWEKKLWIRRFGIRENMSRTFHKVKVR